jgi:oxygen-independent coproporphyrinogen-3 oxidase
MFVAQRRIATESLPPAGRQARAPDARDRQADDGRVRLHRDGSLRASGDELAIAREAGTLHRNFMGYTTHADTDLVGLGVSAISHVGPTYSQNPRDLEAWQAADRRRLPARLPRRCA